MVLNSDWTSWPCGNSTRKWCGTGKKENRKEQREGRGRIGKSRERKERRGKWEEKVETEEGEEEG